MSTATATIAPQKLRKARTVLGLTQAEAGHALGRVRAETVSRWESRQWRVRAVHAQTARYFIQIARMLQEVAPTAEEQQAFLNSPQPDLHGKTPRQIMLDDPPFGAREVYDLLGRIVHGIPA
ncbi:MAG TPA: antitoxin Xre/MbcA/ParS toxin-binding domain-containing protein [bacterium]|nr:antitoxin Xre/MbcA/ParS toxin-binding domain-containing protein [bacterium]